MDALDHVRELERREASLRAASSRLVEAQTTAERVAARVAEIAEWLDRLPGERARTEAILAEARESCDRDRSAFLRGREAAAEDEGDEYLARLAALLEQRLADAERRLGLAEHDRDELERAARDAADAVPALRSQAEIVSATLAATRAHAAEELEPAAGLDGLRSWSSRARAAAFVARSQIDRERDALIREATETASSALGEPLSGASMQVVRRRLAQSRSRSSAGRSDG